MADSKRKDPNLVNPRKIYNHELFDCAVSTQDGAVEFSSRVEDIDTSGIRLFEGDSRGRGKIQTGQTITIRYYRADGPYMFRSQINSTVPTPTGKKLLHIALPKKISKL